MKNLGMKVTIENVPRFDNNTRKISWNQLKVNTISISVFPNYFNGLGFFHEKKGKIFKRQQRLSWQKFRQINVSLKNFFMNWFDGKKICVAVIFTLFHTVQHATFFAEISLNRLFSLPKMFSRNFFEWEQIFHFEIISSSVTFVDFTIFLAKSKFPQFSQ